MSQAPVTTVEQFAQTCATLTNDDIYDLFENKLSDDVRTEISTYSDVDTPEPFRSACYNIGVKFNVQSLIDY